ncbi:MAG: superoxide dismutase [Candidatus Obscuribacterales bacterium]|nr:superoxide dismutase [Candidatus Obscuribacterales bacterium]
MLSKDRELIGNYEVSKEGVVTRREVLMMGAMAAGSVVAATAPQSVLAAETTDKSIADPYKAKDFESLCDKLDGFSASQIKQHLKLYAGYIAKSNELSKNLTTIDLTTANATYSAIRELLIEQSYAVNGVVYHEFYFGNLGGRGGEPQGEVKAGIEERWGSSAKFMDFLKAAGKSARGWVIIGFNTRGGFIDAFALDLHNVASPANIVPLLALDVYEHAYMVDFGIDRGKYLETFIDNINWDVVAKRLTQASKHPTGWDTTV